MEKRVSYKNNVFIVTQRMSYQSTSKYNTTTHYPKPVLVVRKKGTTLYGYIGANLRDCATDVNWKPFLYSTNGRDIKDERDSKGLSDGFGVDSINKAIGNVCKTLYERKQAIDAIKSYVEDHCVENIEGDKYE